MKITLESTSKLLTVDGVPARVWEGHTESGIRIQAFVTRIRVDRSLDQTEFVAEFEEHRPPSQEVREIPGRLTL